MPKHTVQVDPVSGLPVELHTAIQNDHLDFNILTKLIDHMVNNHLIFCGARSEFQQDVRTAEPSRVIGVSYSDTMTGDMDHIVLHVPTRNDSDRYTTAYLSRTQTLGLISTLITALAVRE